MKTIEEVKLEHFERRAQFRDSLFVQPVLWEWCRDYWQRGEISTDPVTDPTGPAEGSERVMRGGSWWYPAASCRSASRFYAVPNRFEYGYFLGFRAALVRKNAK